MKIKSSVLPFGAITDNCDDLAKSRRGALAYTYIVNFITAMVMGTYFVGLMLEMGASETYINVVTVAITVCGFAQFVSPLLLERMKKRKRFLMTLRIIYNFFTVILLGIIPLLPLDRSLMLIVFILTVIAGHLMNSLSLSGISIWHMQNIPADKHSDFFTLANVGSQVINAVMGFLASSIVDAFVNNSVSVPGLTPTMAAFILLRIAALIAAIGELVSLASIKEHPYTENAEEGKAKVSLRTLFTPLSNRPFMKTILIYIIYLFISGLIGKYFQIYLLDVVKMSYTLISASGIISLPIVLLLSPLWSYLLKKLSWEKVLPIALIGTAVGYFFNTLITSDTQYFHILCCVFYASFNVAVAIIFAFLPYANMPETNRTAFVGFFTISGTVAGLMGNLTGILLMNVMQGLEYTLFGLKITSYQTLNLIQTVSFILLAFYSIAATRKKKGTPSQKIDTASETGEPKDPDGDLK